MSQHPYFLSVSSNVKPMPSDVAPNKAHDRRWPRSRTSGRRGRHGGTGRRWSSQLYVSPIEPLWRLANGPLGHVDHADHDRVAQPRPLGPALRVSKISPPCRQIHRSPVDRVSPWPIVLVAINPNAPAVTYARVEGAAEKMRYEVGVAMALGMNLLEPIRIPRSCSSQRRCSCRRTADSRRWRRSPASLARTPPETRSPSGRAAPASRCS